MRSSSTTWRKSATCHMYRTAIYAFGALALIYTIVGSLHVAHKVEQTYIFPIFSWSLFSSPKKSVSMYQMVLDREPPGSAGALGQDGQPAKDQSFPWQPIDPRAMESQQYKALRSFTSDISRGLSLPEAIDKWRPELARFVPADYNGYHLLKIDFDVIELYRSSEWSDAVDTVEYVGYVEVQQ